MTYTIITWRDAVLASHLKAAQKVPAYGQTWKDPHGNFLVIHRMTLVGVTYDMFDAEGYLLRRDQSLTKRQFNEATEKLGMVVLPDGRAAE